MPNSVKFLGFLYLVALLFSLNSCFGSGCEKKPVSAEAKKWFDAYDGIDTLIFESNKGRIDTFIFDEFSDGYSQCNRFELGPNQYNSVSISYTSLASHKREKYQRQIRLAVYTDRERPEAKTYFRVFDGSAHLVESVDSAIVGYGAGTPKIRIPTMFFDNVSPAWYGSFMKSFHWNFEMGLIQYSSLYGETYLLKYRG